MSAEMIKCPSCQHVLRVPETLFGQPVTCPDCRTTFKAPTRNPDGTISAPVLAVRGTLSEPQPARSMLVPGIALLGIGFIGLGLNVVVLVLSLTKPELFGPKVFENPWAQKMLKNFIQNDPTPEELDAMCKSAESSRIMGCSISAIVNLIVVAGSISCLTRRFYFLAMLGSFLAIIDFWPCCCVAGAPIGVFAIVRLLNPEVRESFR